MNAVEATAEEIRDQRIAARVAEELRGIRNPTAFERSAAKAWATAEVDFIYAPDGADIDALDEAVSAAERKLQTAKRAAGRRVRITRRSITGRVTCIR